MKEIREIIKKNAPMIVSIGLLAILCYGAFMRLWHLGYSSYWIDEGFTLMQARGIALHGYPLLDSGYVEWKDPLLSYFVAPFIKFFGFEYAGLLRLPSAIFGIVSIFIAYHLAAQIFSRRTGLMFAFLMASCHWYIAWSQQVRGYAALIFFVLLFFYFLSLHSRHKNMKYIAYASGCLIAGVLVKKFAVLLFVPLMIYLFLCRKYKIFSALCAAALAVAGTFIFLFKSTLVINPLSYVNIYIQEYFMSHFGIFCIIALSGFVGALLYNKDFRNIHYAILSFFIATIIVFSIFIFVVERRYFLMITPFIFLYATFFIDVIVQNFRYRTLLATGFFVLLVGAAVFLKDGIILVPQKHYGLEHYTPQPNYNKAYATIVKNGFMENDTIISSNPPLDIIYLGRPGYVLPWSLTGRGNDNNLVANREFHSGALNLYGDGEETAAHKIQSLQERGRVYVVFDSLAERRMQQKLKNDVVKNGKKILEDGVTSRVYVYYYPKIEE